MSASLVAAIDQGTTSTRCLLFGRDGRIIAADQREHRQLLPRAGWVEHDALEIWRNTRAVVDGALSQANADAAEVAAVGVTNQRETVVVWEAATGRPIAPAIVWQDTRTDAETRRLAASADADLIRRRTGLPPATYFAGPKIAWLLDHVDRARDRAARGELLFGTVDSWLLWQLTGGPAGGVHATDPSNASRTLLMDLHTLQWDGELAELLRVPMSMLPEIRSSSEVYGSVAAGLPLAGVPVAGLLGDQQAATFGQTCFAPGQAKNTYGTGNFLLLNTGGTPVSSQHGLLTTVAFRLGPANPVYALEGSIAVSGSLVQWLRDNLGVIRSAAEVEELARTVTDNGGCYFVPAFSGLFAPYWRPDARGVIAGLTRYVTKGHLARAALEATAYQTKDVVDAMNADCAAAPAGAGLGGVELGPLKVDGGMVTNDLLLQFQADLLGISVQRPVVTETTALGAAYAAGLAVGFWSDQDELENNWAQDRRFEPQMDASERDALYAGWRKAVARTLDWADA